MTQDRFRKAAINTKVLAGDEAGKRADEEFDCVGDIFWIANS